MKTQLARNFAEYLQRHQIDMFAQTTFTEGDYFESEQLVDVPGSDVVPTIIVMTPTAISIEWIVVTEKLAPEVRWSMLEFLNVLNTDLNAFSTVLSPSDADDDFDEVRFRYYEPINNVKDSEQILFTYEFMQQYVSAVLYPEVLAICDDELAE